MRGARPDISLLVAMASAYPVCAVLSVSTGGGLSLVLRVLGGLLLLAMLVVTGRSAWLASQRKARNGGEAYRGWHRWALAPVLPLWLGAFFWLRTVDTDGALFVLAVAVFAAVTSLALLLMVVTNERSYRPTTQVA